VGSNPQPSYRASHTLPKNKEEKGPETEFDLAFLDPKKHNAVSKYRKGGEGDSGKNLILPAINGLPSKGGKPRQIQGGQERRMPRKKIGKATR